MNDGELKRIMLVEDEEDIRAVAKFSLERIGKYVVHYCASGKEALAVVKDFQPQIILLDMMMPEMDGIMTLKALRELPEVATTIIVFMTAKTKNDEIEKYKLLGAAEVISKPFSPKELPNTLNTIWLNNRGKANESRNG